MLKEKTASVFRHSYKSNRNRLKWECSEGHRWSATAGSIKVGSWCPACARERGGSSQRLTIEAPRKLAIKKGGRLLSSEYKNTTTKLRWQCSKGHEWNACYASVQQGSWCPICAGRKPYTLADVQALAKQRGGICESKAYGGAFGKLRWQCYKGHKWEAVPDSIRRGSWCPVCAGERKGLSQKFDINAAHKAAKKNGGKCLSSDYKNIGTPLKWRCKMGHEWNACLNSIHNGTWCPKCGLQRSNDSKKLPPEAMHKIAQERGGECLAATYVNGATAVEWKCALGHVWSAKPVSIRVGSWCPECSEWTSERVCRAYFEKIFGLPFPKSHPTWLRTAEKRSLELDGYCKQLGLAFEHQGRQHYSKKDHDRFTLVDRSFERRQMLDRLKKALCKKHGVTLVEIPQLQADIRLKDLGSFIIKKCQKAGIAHTPAKMPAGSIEWKAVYTPRVMEQLARLESAATAKGGKLVGKAYINNMTPLLFECQKGHQWEARPDHIKDGHWCPYCSGHKRHTIEIMRAIAEERGGQCLSTKYIHGEKKLKWSCSEKHIWMATPQNIKRGSWCPVCGRKQAAAKRRSSARPDIGGKQNVPSIL